MSKREAENKDSLPKIESQAPKKLNLGQNKEGKDQFVKAIIRMTATGFEPTTT